MLSLLATSRIGFILAWRAISMSLPTFLLIGLAPDFPVGRSGGGSAVETYPRISARLEGFNDPFPPARDCFPSLFRNPFGFEEGPFHHGNALMRALSRLGLTQPAQGLKPDRRTAELRHGVEDGAPEILRRGDVRQEVEGRNQSAIIPNDDAAHLGEGGLGDLAGLEFVRPQIDAANLGEHLRRGIPRDHEPGMAVLARHRIADQLARLFRSP